MRIATALIVIASLAWPAAAADFSDSARLRGLQHRAFEGRNSFQNWTSSFQNRKAPFQERTRSFETSGADRTDFGSRNTAFAVELDRQRADREERRFKFVDQEREARFNERMRNFTEAGEVKNRFSNMRLKFEDPRFESLNFNAY